ncbi:MAG: DUF1264 domain-containing protein [Candidatus Diapherotrites archaeon]|uniref:DUF1264 domain-containing protein n=1 Tax=Candidatus Iainarchaeum sp. TaxID=3101447 RepID=A0A8T4LG72_9ARCH|nr:DUF1264 domain-containing protein [Candidatus Diapherotrites archaeon]
MGSKIIWIGLVALALVLSGCAQAEQKQQAVAGPQQGYDLHVDAKHWLKDKRETVHHWCKPTKEKLFECLLFDSDAANANIVGTEVIVENGVWETFDDEEKGRWHDHKTEIVEAEATLPGMPEAEAQKWVEALMQTHGRVIYFWNYPRDAYPIGRPFMDSDH